MALTLRTTPEQQKMLEGLRVFTGEGAMSRAVLKAAAAHEGLVKRVAELEAYVDRVVAVRETRERAAAELDRAEAELGQLDREGEQLVAVRRRRSGRSAGGWRGGRGADDGRGPEHY